MKKVLEGCGMALGVFVLVVVLLITGLFLLLRGEEQKPPQITTGEFPFVVEYEMNGEKFVIEDTVVCEFSGYDLSALTFNKPRSWNAYLKSREEEKRLFIECEPNTNSVLVDGRINIESRVLLQYGDAEYYMGDPNGKSLTYDGQPRITYVEYFQTGPKSYEYTSTEMSNEQLEKYFGIKIIKFEFSKPIKNEFK